MLHLTESLFLTRNKGRAKKTVEVHCVFYDQCGHTKSYTFTKNLDFPLCTKCKSYKTIEEKLARRSEMYEEKEPC